MSTLNDTVTICIERHVLDEVITAFNRARPIVNGHRIELVAEDCADGLVRLASRSYTVEGVRGGICAHCRVKVLSVFNELCFSCRMKDLQRETVERYRDGLEKLVAP